jgi:hydroxymethylbilane synthase
VRDLILKKHSSCAISKTVVTTKGDAVQNCSLHEIGGQGVFVRELDNAILRGEIDCAVHSMKDIPSTRPKGISTIAVLARDPPYDFLAHSCAEDMIQIIGTSSTRRKAQMLRYHYELGFSRPITVSPLRGNVDTRLLRLRNGEYDAVMLAEAGLVRLGYQVPGQRLKTDYFVPSPNQGTIAIVCLDDKTTACEGLHSLLSSLHDPESGMDAAIERVVMEEIGGGCFTPQGIYCNRGHLTAEVLSLDGTQCECITEHVSSLEQAREIGRELQKQALHLIKAARLELELS